MTRRRTLIFVLGVCIGTLLLLFDNAVAEVTEAPIASEKSESQKVSTPQGPTTILTKVFSTSADDQNRSFAENDGKDIELNRKTHDAEDRSYGSVNSTNQDGEKDVSIHVNSHTEKLSDDFESSSSDGNRKPRYGEIAESSGKSTSTKVISEDLLRLSRKNELTATTTKISFNDSKQDSKNLEDDTPQESSNHEKISNTTKITSPNTKEKITNEKLIANVQTSESKEVGKESSVKYEEENNIAANKEIPTKSSSDFFSMTSKSTSEDTIRSDEKKDKIIKFDHKEVVSRTDKNTILPDLKEELEDHTMETRELVSVHGENSPGFKKDVNDLGTTASEALDLEKIDEKGHEGTVSLANDTYVNYDHVYKSVTEKDSKTNMGNHSIDVNKSREGDPKEEVEIVKNVTHLPVLRLVTTTNDTTKNDSHVDELSNQEGAAYVKKAGTSAADENHREHSVDSSISNVTTKSIDSVEKWKSIGEPESQVKLAETIIKSVRLEERTSPTPETTPSLVPQGRTIGFSGINKFPNIEGKSTASMRTDGELSVAHSLRNSTDKIDQKPYPYLKFSSESFQVITEASLQLKKEGGDVTEETSAYENTIGRGETEKKFVVTEPSVVIENSIQQHKPNKKNVNETTNSTTKSLSSLIPVTAIPIVSTNIRSINETFPKGLNSSVKATEIKRSKSSENDTPSAKEEEKVIAGRDEGYDVTGNGITEVTPDGKEVKSHSSEAAESSTLHSTETNTSKTVSLNTDVQMEPEEAMMIRSTFVVTESTSMVPLNKDTTTEVNKKISTTSTAEINTIAMMVLENTTESSAPKTNVTLRPSSSANQTTESPSVTLNPDESSIPTTTSIEFEFISLTGAISSGTNATERSVEGRTFEEQTMSSRTTTVQDPSVTNNSTEDAVTALKPEDSTEFPMTTKDEISTTDQLSGMHRVNNETTESPQNTHPQTTSENQSNRTEFTRNVTISVIDFTSTTVVDATGAFGVTEDPLKSKDSSFNANITEMSAPGVTELPPNIGIRTTTNITKSPSATSTLEPIIPWSTGGFTKSPEEEITESIHSLSDEITLFVKIIIEGTLQEVCPRLQDLKKALADILRDGLDKPVQPRQIIIHQNPCLEQNSSPTPPEISLTSILIFVVDENGKFDAAMTKILPSLYKVSRDFPVKIHKFLLLPEADSGNAIAVVVVSSVAFICLVLLAGLLFIMRKRQTRFNYGERCRPVSLDAYSLDSVSAYNSVRRKGAARSSKRSYGNPTFEDSSAIPSHPLNFAGLSSFCNDVNAINEEFAGIPQVSAKIDELPPGAEVKNRYANVIPLPETRVPLQRLNNDALTEYINASYVRGPKNATKYYIACQAPIESTVTDFWRMIWEQQCKVIIMLTDLVENEVEKCTEYIPPSEVTDCHRLYGDFQVTLKKRETKEKYAISTLHLKNLENNTFREVFHIWYLWPVNGVQSDGTGLIAVLLEARALQRGGPGPIVVHCSPGTGRTGTLIALDLGIRQYEITRTVDVPRVVYTIRRDRAGAVQTKEQYAFIYKALNLYATKLAGGVLEST